MPRRAKRQLVNHQDVADRARKTPGVDVPVGPYRSAYSAKDTARSINSTYRMPMYEPAGSFEARADYDADQEPIVLVRYVGQPQGGEV